MNKQLLVNATLLKRPLTGIGHYTYQLLSQLKTSLDVGLASSTYAVNGKKADQLLSSLEQPAFSAQASRHSLHGLTQYLITSAKSLPAARQLRDSLVAHQLNVLQKKSSKNTIYWEPNYHLVTHKFPAWATIYDLSYIRYPGLHPTERLKWLEKSVPKTLEEAQGVFTISDFSRNEIHQYYGYPLNKIHLVPPGLGAAFKRQSGPDLQFKFKQQNRLPERYLLCVSTLEPRKNITGLLNALEHLEPSFKSAYPLVIAGAKGWQLQGLKARLESLQKKGWVYLLGYVPQEKMPLLYASAEAMIYPSLYEGFGMPIIEAMAQSTPVIASNLTAIPEVTQNSALLIDPHNSQVIATAIERLISDPSLQQSLTQQGSENVKRFCWQASANRMLDCWL